MWDEKIGKKLTEKEKDYWQTLTWFSVFDYLNLKDIQRYTNQEIANMVVAEADSTRLNGLRFTPEEFAKSIVHEIGQKIKAVIREDKRRSCTVKARKVPEVLKMAKKGMLQREIAAASGLSERWVGEIIRKNRKKETK